MVSVAKGVYFVLAGISIVFILSIISSLDDGDNFSRGLVSEDWKSYVATVRQTLIRELGKHFQPGTKVALLSIPFSGCNCGDYTLGVGTKLFLDEMQQNITFQARVHGKVDPEQVRNALGPDGVILVYPGGNFGDLWGFQDTYMSWVRTFHDYPIYFLPNTVLFHSSQVKNVFRKTIEEHGRVKIFMREKHSFNLCRSYFPKSEVYLTPDMAFMYGPIERRRIVQDTAPSSPILFLKRTDKESKQSVPFKLNPEVVQKVDFTDPVNCKHLLYAKRTVPVENTISDYSTRVADVGFSILSRGQVVVTDRLHGHLMSLLQGIPHIVLNNNYHKLSSMMDTWTSRSGITHSARSVTEALDMAEKLLCRMGEPKYCGRPRLYRAE